jgi:hypothetical protein
LHSKLQYISELGWAHDCTIDIVSPHLGSCIVIGSLWRVLISSCESHRRRCGGKDRRKHGHLLSTSTAQAHPLPRQLLQSNIWAPFTFFYCPNCQNKGDDVEKLLGRRLGTLGWTSCSVSRNSRTFPIPSALTIRK